jgi:tetraacyldisaccharide 4'-kinase
VGNISFGGTEKTPLAWHLLSLLAQRGYKPALISRGYKGKWEHHGGILSDGNQLYGDWKDAGDEPYMIARNLHQAGVFIGKDRLASCMQAEKMGFDIAVLDDGFQHRRLQKDIDIVLFDPTEKVALRESFSALKRCHLLLVKKSEKTRISGKLKKSLQFLTCFEYTVTNQGIYTSTGNTSVAWENLKGKKILAVSGIAKPKRFISFLETQGLMPYTFLQFPDHHAYPVSSIKRIKHSFISHKSDIIITTEKDIFKISNKVELKDLPIYYLKISLEIDPDFYNHIFSKLPSKET